jgi:uncharacterized protein
MRKLLRLLVPASVIYVLLCAAAAVFLADTTVHPNRRPLPADAEVQIRDTAAALQSEVADVQIPAVDNAALSAWFIHPRHSNGDAVILLHGLGDNRLGTIGYAELLLKHGYSVLMPDARAHGASGGRIATYGLIEQDDVRRWFEWLARNEQPGCIYALGESMGAAELLQSLKAESGFCAVIAESAFSSFREIAYDRIGQQFHVGPWVGRTVLRPIIEIALGFVRWKYHLNLAEVEPEQVVAHTHVPVLLIHGQIDGNIPVRHSRRIKLRNAQVVLWEVPGADHCGAISVAREEFLSKVLNWFAAHRRVEPSRGQSLVTANR